MKARVFLPITLALTAVQSPAQSTYIPYSWSTIAGSGNAQFASPTSVAVDLKGNVYVADALDHVIRKASLVGKNWMVTSLAGQPGISGFRDGTGSSALFNNPLGVAADTAGDVYVADTGNNVIRKITPQGVVQTLAGDNPSNLGPNGIPLGGFFNGSSAVALFSGPTAVAVDTAGNLYVADTDNDVIRKMTPAPPADWQVTSLAGSTNVDAQTGLPWGSTDGAGSEAKFDNPQGLAVDGAGNLYVADTGNCEIRKVTPAGVVSTLAGDAADVLNNILAGLPQGNVDGPARRARFYFPAGVAVDSAGNVYVADSYNDEIRKLTPDGIVSTLGGRPASFYDGFGAFGRADFLDDPSPDDIGGDYSEGTGSAAQFHIPTGVAVDAEGNLYVADDNNLLIRKGVPPQVQMVALEATQVIQDWSNTIPLVQSKETYVRAHLQLAPTASGSVIVSGARLYGSGLGGGPLPGSPIFPINEGGSLTVRTKNAADPSIRGQFINSLNFRLPQDWLSGTITLQLAWSGGLQAMNVLPNDGAVQLTFAPVAAPRVKFFAVNWTDAGGTLHLIGLELDDLRRRVLSCYPVASVAATFGTLPWPDKNLPDTADVNTKLSSQRFRDVAWGYVSLHPIGNTIYHGAIPADELDGSAVSPLPSFVSSGNVLGYYGDGRQTAPHELGHNLGREHDVNLALFGIETDRNGRQHAKGACKELGPVTYTYPLFQPSAGYSLGAPTLGPMTQGNNSLIYGLDTLTLQSTTKEPVVSPTGLSGAAGDPTCYFDLMSYCRQDGPEERWPSSATYTNLLCSINATFDPPPQVPQPGPQPLGGSGGGTYLMVRGTVDFNVGTAQFLPFLTISTTNAPPAPPMGTNFLLQALDGSGTVLQTIAFALEPSIVEENSTNQTAAFIVPVQAEPTIQTVQLWYNGAMVAKVTASPHAPTLALTKPNGGQDFATGAVNVAWSASDPDGDPLTYTVEYSADNGVTWQTLAVDWPGLNLAINSAELDATTKGLMRIIASDGFNTTTAQSAAPFTVRPHAPTVSINSPRDGSIFMADQQLFLDVTASDMQDGLLNGTNVQWRSDRDGALGSGAILTFDATRLSEGHHTITVTATDTAGLTNSAVTHLLELHYPPPQLSLLFTPATNELGRYYPANATITWPAYYTNYVLQSSANLVPGWAAMTSPAPQVSGYWYSANAGVSNARSFFRLVLKP